MAIGTSRRMHALRIGTLALAVALIGETTAAAQIGTSGGPNESPIQVVTLPAPDSSLVAIRLMFRAGSIHDPRGKEGLAALTALMVARAGTSQRSYPDFLEALYPMAASISSLVDREVTVFAGQIHRERLAEFTDLLAEALLDPGFRAEDLQRNREQLLAYLTTTLRSASDELLGLEALQQRIFAGHPYEHAAAGTVAGLRAITMEDVTAFYRTHYTQRNLLLGVAGGYTDAYLPELETRLGRLPEGDESEVALPAPATTEGRRFTLVEKETGSVGIHFGHPLPLTRADADYYPLMVANSYLGEHRTFHGRLMQQMRGLRGLNYGDYSYIEYWRNPPGTTTPSPNVPRRQQYFSVWVRPVVPDTAHFAIRNAVYEVDRLIDRGLTPEEFELTREFLINYSKLWAQRLSERLGFLLDSRFYGMPYYIDEIERRLNGLSVDDVNRAARKYLQTSDIEVVMVTANAARMKETLERDEPSPMTYGTPMPEEVLAADTVIQSLPLRPAAVRILPVTTMFEQ